MGRAEQPCDLPQALSPPFTTSLEDSTTLSVTSQTYGAAERWPWLPACLPSCARTLRVDTPAEVLP